MFSSRIANLKELIELEEQRSAIEQELSDLVTQMASLRESLFDEPSVAASPSATSSLRAVGKPRRSRRGALKKAIVKLLSAAGPEGISVKTISQKSGAAFKNISVWFSTTGRKLPNLKKLGPGLYRLG